MNQYHEVKEIKYVEICKTKKCLKLFKEKVHADYVTMAGGWQNLSLPLAYAEKCKLAAEAKASVSKNIEQLEMAGGLCHTSSSCAGRVPDKR